jgi:hypothetical protein
VLQDVKLRKDNMIKIEVADRLNDNGKKLRLSLATDSLEPARLKLLNKALHSLGGPTGALVQVSHSCPAPSGFDFFLFPWGSVR